MFVHPRFFFPNTTAVVSESDDSNAKHTLRASLNTVHGDDDGYTWSLDMPGVPKDQVSLQVSQGILSVEGTHTTDHVSRTFTNKWRLPRDADESTLQADYTDGVLTITVSKEAPSTRKIPLK